MKVMQTAHGVFRLDHVVSLTKDMKRGSYVVVMALTNGASHCLGAFDTAEEQDQEFAKVIQTLGFTPITGENK